MKVINRFTTRSQGKKKWKSTKKIANVMDYNKYLIRMMLEFKESFQIISLEPNTTHRRI